MASNINVQKTSVILLSGGQDSATSLLWALSKFDRVVCVSFSYGQMHSLELQFAKELASKYGCEHKLFDVSGLLPSSSLTERSDHNERSKINKDLPASFTAGRNLLFLTIAGSFAVSIGVNDLITGVCQTDYSGYPDCRQSTMDATALMLTLGLGGGDIRIHTPLMYLTKAETWRLAKDLGGLDTIINSTLTDYNGDLTPNAWGYGKENNPASILRASGYREAVKKGWI